MIEAGEQALAFAREERELMRAQTDALDEQRTELVDYEGELVDREVAQ